MSAILIYIYISCDVRWELDRIVNEFENGTDCARLRRKRGKMVSQRWPLFWNYIMYTLMYNTVPCDGGFVPPTRDRRDLAVRDTRPRLWRVARGASQTAGSWEWTQIGKPGPDNSPWSAPSAGRDWTAGRTIGCRPCRRASATKTKNKLNAYMIFRR